MNTLPKLLMHLEDYPQGLKVRCFEFFYWFSRFEYALKENDFLGRGPHNAAIPNWTKFKTRFARTYEPSNAARRLLADPPWRQVWNAGAVGWERLHLNREKTDLGRSILVVKTIRNNLFHGGKSNEKDWDEPDRNIFFLSNGKEVLDSFAGLGNLLADYRRYYWTSEFRESNAEQAVFLSRTSLLAGSSARNLGRKRPEEILASGLSEPCLAG